MLKIVFLYTSLLLSLFSCQQKEAPNPFYAGIEDIQQKKAFLMEVTFPAGSDSGNAFLPYPANHGFCTENAKIEVLTITDRLEKGIKVAVYPMATLILNENNTERNIILASPIDTALQVINVRKFQNFIVSQAGIQQIVQDWFLYEKGLGKVDLVGWKDEQYAWKLLNE